MGWFEFIRRLCLHREFWLGFDDEQMRASLSEFPQRFGMTQALHSYYQVWMRKQEMFILQCMLRVTILTNTNFPLDKEGRKNFIITRFSWFHALSFYDGWISEKRVSPFYGLIWRSNKNGCLLTQHVSWIKLRMTAKLRRVPEEGRQKKF